MSREQAEIMVHDFAADQGWDEYGAEFWEGDAGEWYADVAVGDSLYVVECRDVYECVIVEEVKI